MSIKENKSSLECPINTNLFVISLFKFVIVTVILYSASQSTFAWGPLGHKAICDAAWRASDSGMRQALASSAKRMGYKTYAESCLWADDIRRDRSYAWAKPLHYMNLPRDADSVVDGSCAKKNRAQAGSKPQCVWPAIQHYHQRWQNTGLSRKQRDEALLLFSHFVADIHQPLHVAYRDDRGGTRRNVTFEGRLMSLHSLWDSPILYCGTRSKWRQLGKQLSRNHSRYNGSETADIAVWADESFALTRLIYGELSSRLPASYCDKFHPLAMVRLELASLRLAELFKSKPFDAEPLRPSGGDSDADKVQSAPNLIERFSLFISQLLAALWKSILTLPP